MFLKQISYFQHVNIYLISKILAAIYFKIIKSNFLFHQHHYSSLQCHHSNMTI